MTTYRRTSTYGPYSSSLQEGSVHACSHSQNIDERDAGFTLIELLVVMIIVGILAAIVIPVFP